MKKLLLVLMLLTIVLSACTPPAGGDDAQVTKTEQPTVEQTSKTANVDAESTTESETTEPVVTDGGQSPIQYQDVINKDMYTGFSDAQLAMLNKNGFVVLKPKTDYPNTFMHHSYEGSEYSKESVFITTDLVLNMFHMYYSGSMKALETAYYYNDVRALTNGLIGKVAAKYSTVRAELKPHYQRLYAYLALGGRLLHDDSFSYQDIGEGYESSYLQKVTDKSSDVTAQWQRLYRALPEDVMALVEHDYQLIQGQSGMTESKILKKEFDTTQYVVRGHYTQSPVLSNYFKGMMWFSQSGFDVSMDKRDNLIMVQLLSQLIDSDKTLAKTWQNIYRQTAFYSGLSDDLDHTSIVTMNKAVYGDVVNSDQFIDASYDEALSNAIKALPLPKIKPVLGDDTTHADLDYTRQYRLMGQRFSFDTYAMTKLTKSPERLNISPFDVLASTGNRTSEKILYAVYQPDAKWSEYPERLSAMKAAFKSYKSSAISDLYKGWFLAIDHALNILIDDAFPYFMQTDAYAYKNVNTALGSFAELKHDNILYAKQMVAEMGGAEPDEGYPLHYVEPNVALYSHLLGLIEMAQANSAVYDDPAIKKPLQEMAKYLKLFTTVSRKQLNSQSISQSELEDLTYFGGFVDYINVTYNYYLQSLLMDSFEPSDSSALIADIATIIDLGYLEVATGLPLDVYALVDINGQPVITKGVVYASYSFYSDERLTDEAWLAMNGLAKGEFGYPEYDATKNQVDITAMMPYTKAFVAEDDNKVEFQYIEMNWPKE